MKLEDFPIVKCTDGEKVLCIQRQHPIVLFNRMILQFGLLSVILISVILTSFSLSGILPFNLNNNIITLYIALVSISVYAAVGLYTYMDWYYQFYIITNKALVHRRVFRISGPYSEVVFGDKMHIQEIDRRPQNLIYDFLRIQDIYVYFHKLEREEPFIFKMPGDSQAIEDILDNLISQARSGANTA